MENEENRSWQLKKHFSSLCARKVLNLLKTQFYVHTQEKYFLEIRSPSKLAAPLQVWVARKEDQGHIWQNFEFRSKWPCGLKTWRSWCALLANRGFCVSVSLAPSPAWTSWCARHQSYPSRKVHTSCCWWVSAALTCIMKLNEILPFWPLFNMLQTLFAS